MNALINSKVDRRVFGRISTSILNKRFVIGKIGQQVFNLISPSIFGEHPDQKLFNVISTSKFGQSLGVYHYRLIFRVEIETAVTIIIFHFIINMHSRNIRLHSSLQKFTTIWREKIVQEYTYVLYSFIDYSLKLGQQEYVMFCFNSKYSNSSTYSFAAAGDSHSPILIKSISVAPASTANVAPGRLKVCPVENYELISF